VVVGCKEQKEKRRRTALLGRYEHECLLVLCLQLGLESRCPLQTHTTLTQMHTGLRRSSLTSKPLAKAAFHHRSCLVRLLLSHTPPSHPKQHPLRVEQMSSQHTKPTLYAHNNTQARKPSRAWPARPSSRASVSLSASISMVRVCVCGVPSREDIPHVLPSSWDQCLIPPFPSFLSPRTQCP
jgi:hypothetical protein